MAIARVAAPAFPAPPSRSAALAGQGTAYADVGRTHLIIPSGVATATVLKVAELERGGCISKGARETIATLDNKNFCFYFFFSMLLL